MRFLITGVTGFVGNALANTLTAQGHYVVGVGRKEKSFPFPYIRKDLHDITPEDITPFLPLDGIFHTAAKVGMWGAWSEFERTNVEGTRRLLTIAQALKIPRFVYTSSPSVIANGNDLRNIDERQPYPKSFHAAYPRSKAEAEKLVLRAHTSDFKTIALRPHLIFGPGDTNLIPTIVTKARLGKLPIIGSGKNLCDFSFIEDCVSAHILAMKALNENQNAGGRAYFISQGEPFALWTFINSILAAHGINEITRKIPTSLALALATGAEFVCRLVNREPPLTRFLVEEMATDHYFDIRAARKELGYVPQFTIQQALEKTFSSTEALCVNG